MALILVSDELSPADCAFLEAMAKGLITARRKYPGNEGRFVALAAESGEAFHAIQRLMSMLTPSPEPPVTDKLKEFGFELCEFPSEGGDCEKCGTNPRTAPLYWKRTGYWEVEGDYYCQPCAEAFIQECESYDPPEPPMTPLEAASFCPYIHPV